MEDDDDFGDLYADVIRPISASPPPPTFAGFAPRPSYDPIPDDDDDDDDDDEILYGSHRPDPSASYSSRPSQTLAPTAINIDGDGDWLTGAAPTAVVTPENWDEDEEKEVEARTSIDPAPDSSSIRQSRVSEDLAEARASDGDAEIGGLRIREDDGDPFLGGEEKVEIENDPFQELVIPGLSPGPPAAISVKDIKASASEDWDSDSEDDLQIVLNDNNPLPPVGTKNNGVGNYDDDDDDEDGEEDLVIVTDTDQPHLPQAVEELEWGDDSMRSVVDGEMKETGDSRKPNAASGSAPAARTGYGNQGFHPQHHSVYKYVRPGAGPVLGGPVVGLSGGPAQIRPPPTLGPILGRGRGDWRPAGIRGPMNTQKPFNSGYGLSGWANNSSMRAFGGGYDFTLPSHKTIFEVDIDGFEEKPWRYPGVDISDFFNFGLVEDKWKDYCKQLEQLRLEVTMQNKICVYESGRSQQDYDPDLPPELAPVAGHHDRSTGNVHHCRTENGIAELNDPGKEATCIPAPLPIGRAIQVEGGYGDRLPSIDTRPPRNCDIGAIIEIVLQDTLDSSITDGALKQPEKVLGDLSVGDIGENTQAESEYSDRFPHTFNGRNRAMVTRKTPFAPKGDGILPCPSESPLRYRPDIRSRNPIDSTGPFGAHLGGRLPQEISHDRRHIERPRESKEQKRTNEVPSTLSIETAMEQRDGEHGDRLALDDDSIMVEEDDMASDFQETPGDDGSTRSTKKQNLRSRVEQPLLQQNGGNDLRTTNSDNSIVKSGSSKDDQKRREGGEEVVQYGRLRRVGDSRNHQEEEERNVHRKDYRRDERHGIERNRVAPRDHSHLSRDKDFISAHTVRGRSDGFGRSKELDVTTSGRQRREDDTHNTRVKEESTKRDRHDETSSRSKSRVKASEMNNKDDGLHSKKQGDVGDRRDSRHRDKDDNLVRRREVDDPSSKRKKDEENSRREKNEKEDSLHNYRSREDSNRRKRERDDGAEHRRREEESRTRGKVEERHSGNHKDDSCRQKEKEERSRLKPHEELPRHGEREGREGTRNVRTTGDKPLPGNGKNKDNMKDVVPDKDNYRKDRRRPNEQSKRLDRASEGNDSHNKGREKQTDNERSSRHERVSSHNGRSSNASDREKNRENTRKSRDIEVNGEAQGSTKRKLEDHNAQRNDKIDKDTREQEINDASPVKKVRQHNNEPEASQLHHSSGELEEDLGSDDENQKGGRSKLERWTSHKERDFTGTVEIIQALAPISGVGEAEDPNAEMLPVDDLKAETRNPNDSNPNFADAGQGGDRTGEDRDRHFDTVEKLKRRSERFKLPMPGEKEAAAGKKPENEILPPPPPNEDPMADDEVKPERPARKRRWTSS